MKDLRDLKDLTIHDVQSTVEWVDYPEVSMSGVQCKFVNSANPSTLEWKRTHILGYLAYTKHSLPRTLQ